MDPELNRYILLNEAKGLVPGYPQSSLDILGKHNIAAVSGFAHKQIRGSAMLLIGPSTVKEQLLPKIDKYMRLFLQNWDGKAIDIQEKSQEVCVLKMFHNSLNQLELEKLGIPSYLLPKIDKYTRLFLQNWDGKAIDIQEKSQEMAFFLSFNQIFEDESSVIYEAFKAEFDKFVVGTISLPINLPGTNYYKGLQARKNIVKLLTEVIKSRRAASSTFHHDDMLNSLLANEDSSYKLNDEEIYDQIMTILNSGYETLSTTSMMAVKYLHEHPKALEEIREEHFMVRHNKSLEQPIDWNDYKSMRFTRAVIFETLRLATVVNGVLRKATKDMELNGFLIPKGWKIYVFTREVNYDPYLYPEPFKFNPWRWLQDMSLESHSYFFLFGGGSRLCPGKELGIVTISVFLHYFVTRYRWEEIGENKIRYFPRVEAPEGLHTRVMKYQ
ncbi:cytochrome P450 85A isoform X1 [Coffea arabica]